MKNLLICCFMMVFHAGFSQKTDHIIIDSNEYGTLYFASDDSVYWVGEDDHVFLVEKRLPSYWTEYKLLGESILFTDNGKLQSIDVNTDLIDTLFQLSTIDFYDRIVLKDSVVALVGNYITLFDLPSNTTQFSIGSNWAHSNLLLGENECFFFISTDSIQKKPMNDMNQHLIRFDYTTKHFETIAHVKNVDHIVANEWDDWEGMFLQDHLLFVQFIQELMVFDLDKHLVLAQTDLLNESTLIQEISKNRINFLNQSTGKLVLFDRKKNNFRTAN